MNEKQLAAMDRLVVVVIIVAGVVLSALGDSEHAGLLLAGALGALSPLVTRAPGAARVVTIALGLAGAVALQGCAGASTADVVRSACGAARMTCAAVEATCSATTGGDNGR